MSSKLNILLFFLSVIFCAFSSFSFSTKVYADNFNLSGSVKDSSGNAIAGATLTVNDANSDSITTDSSGNYNLSVPSGTYNVQVNPATGSSFSSAIAKNQTISNNTILNFILTPIGTESLSGHIYGPEGNALSNKMFR
jgi:hypothetical protein